MDGEFGGCGAGDVAEHFVGGEDVGGVVKEVADGDDAGAGYLAELSVGEFSLCGEFDVVPGGPDLILEDLKPLLLLVVLIVEQQPLKILHGLNRYDVINITGEDYIKH